jgi:hypothetical protein
MTRGRAAALPLGEPPARPATLIPETLVVEHRDIDGRVIEFDFELVPCPAPMRVSLAALFAARCARGGWNSHESSKGALRNLKVFLEWLSKQHPAVEDLDALTPLVWNHWRLSRPATQTGISSIRIVANLLRGDPRISPLTRDALSARVQPVKVAEESFTPEEFAEIQTAARRTFRAAHLRITENIATLEAWRSGAIAEGADQWLVGQALDCLARTGDIPRYTAVDANRGDRRRTPYRYARALGGDRQLTTWQRLYLSRDEAIALAALLALEHGLNLSTINRLKVPRASPDPGEDGFPVYRLELGKRRRSKRRQFETRNFADFGAASPGRLITQALQTTGPTRAFLQEHAAHVDRLIVWHRAKPMAELDSREGEWCGPFSFGVISANASNWAKAEGLAASPFRRGRRTVNVMHRREPGQNTQATHDSVYALRDRNVQRAAVEVIAAGVDDALEHARKAVLVAVLRERPEDGDLPTPTADCHDNDHSPFSEHGMTCKPRSCCAWPAPTPGSTPLTTRAWLTCTARSRACAV